MKAVVLRQHPPGGPLRAEVAELEVPSPGPGELLVKMGACGLCGTDIEKMRGEYSAAMPIIGHEAVGKVSEVGDGVEGFSVGDRVFPHHHVPCHSCYLCGLGEETLCSRYKTSNIDPGGFSEFIRVPEWNVRGGGVLKLPSGMRFDEGVLIEPLACCVRALERCGVRPADTVLVVGAGPIGMMHATLLNSLKAKVIVSDVVEPRLKFAEGAGVGSVLNAQKEDVADAAKAQTGGRGVDIAIVASGSPRAVVQAMKSVRKGGTVCLFGIPVEGSVLDYDLSKLYSSSIQIRPSYGAVEAEALKAIDFLSKNAKEFALLITHKYPLGEFDRGVQAIASGEGMKVIITP